MKAKFYLEIEQEINEIDGNLTTSENVEQALMYLLSIINNPLRNIERAGYQYSVKKEVIVKHGH